MKPVQRGADKKFPMYTHVHARAHAHPKPHSRPLNLLNWWTVHRRVEERLELREGTRHSYRVEGRDQNAHLF